jgi:hypothetical protein
MNVLLLRWDIKPSKRSRGTFLRPQAHRRTCFYAATAKADYPTARVTITVPNRCLGKTVPTWIRLDDLTTRSKAPHGINDYSDNPFNATGGSESTPRLAVPGR